MNAPQGIITPYSVIREHIASKCELLKGHPDTVDGHLNHEQAVTNDYLGRVLYELLQNAVDRAEKHIWINVDRSRKSLIVANDGESFGYVKREGEPRSDFAALCAIDTSNKAMGKSIGNKGVGFKSVWSIGNSVQIRTRSAAIGAWGFRLRWPFNADHLSNWNDQTLATDIEQSLKAAKLEQKHRGCAPSFYFPEYIESPSWTHPDAVTAIELENLNEDALDILEGLVDELVSRPLIFVSDIRIGVELTLSVQSTHLEQNLSKPLFIESSRWLRLDVDVAAKETELASALNKLGVEFGRSPRLTLAFPIDAAAQAASAGLVHSYLPTNQATGSFIELHGDFYLEESRKSVDFRDIHYNALLLDLAADALLKALLINDQGLAHCSLALDFLKVNSLIGCRLLMLLKGDGERLSCIVAHILQGPYEKTDVWYQNFYNVLGLYKPEKTEHMWDAHYQNTIKPFLSPFISKQLKLIPSQLESRSDDVVVVTEALPWPKIERSGKFKGKVFSRKGKQALENISVPGVIVTDWTPPLGEPSLGKLLKTLDLFSDYDRLQVLRSIQQAQLNESDSEKKGELLQVAQSVYAPEQPRTTTHWLYVDAVNRFPSQLLYLPTQTGDWQQAYKIVVESCMGEYRGLIDSSHFSFLDEEKCCHLLGENWLSTVLYWGCWSGIPLRKFRNENVQSNSRWQASFDQKAVDLIDENIVRKSWKVWSQDGSKQQLTELYQQLQNVPFMLTHSRKKVRPANVFLTNSTSHVAGYHTALSPLGYDPSNHLGINTIEQTDDIAKLVRLTQRIFPANTSSAAIASAPLSIYRNVIKRINRCLTSELSDAVIENLQKIPIPYEVGKGARGLLSSSDDRAWYIPGQLRSSKSRFLSAEHKVWLNTGDVATLSKRLVRIKHLTSQPRAIRAESKFDGTLLQKLKSEYLPKFLALVNYSDMAGIGNIEEVELEKRWNTVEVLRTEQAILEEETVDSSGQPVILKTDIQLQGWLWRPYYNQAPDRLKLYVLSDRDVGDSNDALCRWFAEEVFRQRDLTSRFQQLLNKPESIDLGEPLIQDAKGLIDSWLSFDVEQSLLEYLESFVGESFAGRHWRDVSTYVENHIDYAALLSDAPDQVIPALKLLNPAPYNVERLDSFLQSHTQHLATMPENKKRTLSEWLQLFSADPAKTLFYFEPRSWLLAQLELSALEFDKLKNSVNFQLTELKKDTGAIQLGDVNAVATVTSILKATQAAAETATVVVATKTDIERANIQQRNSQAGKNVEAQLALGRAQSVNTLGIDDKSRFRLLLQQEYQRLGLNTRPDIHPYLAMSAEQHTELTWSKLMHFGDIGDGSGYDVLDFDTENKRLMMIEVKSSRSTPAEINLSEPERRQVLKYRSTGFKQEYPNHQWQLLLAIKTGELKDVSEIVGDLLQEHAVLLPVNSNIKAQSWLISGFGF
jgi:hypothetical protein